MEIAQPVAARGIARVAMQTFVAQIAVTILGVITGIIVAKTTGPYGKGLYSGLQVATALIGVAASGAGTSITYLLTRKAVAPGRLLLPFGLLGTGAAALVAIGAVIAGASTHWTIAYALAAAAPSTIVLAWQPAFYTGMQRLPRMNAQLIALEVLTIALVVLLVIPLHLGFDGALIGMIAANTVVSLLIVVDLVKAGGVQRGEYRQAYRTVAGYGSQAAVNGILSLVNYRVDSILLAALMGATSFGIYSIAINVGQLLFVLSRSVTAAVTRDIGVLPKAASAALAARTIRTVTALVACCAVICAAAAPSAIGIVYGSAFMPAAAPLYWLLPGIVAFATVGTFSAFFLFSLEQPGIATRMNSAMIAVQVAACLVLVPKYGLSGAAIASTITYLCGAIYATLKFRQATGIAIRDMWILRGSDLAGLAEALVRRRPARTRRPAPVPLLRLDDEANSARFQGSAAT